MVKEIIFPAESGGAGPTRFVVEDEKRGMLWVREYHPRHGKNRKLQPMTPRRWKQLQREADRGLVSAPRLASIDEYKRLLSARRGLPSQEKQRLVKGIKKTLPHDMPVMGWGSEFVFPDIGRRHLQKVLSYLEGEGYRIVKVRDIEMDFSTDFPRGGGYQEDAKEVTVAPMHMVLGKEARVERSRPVPVNIALSGKRIVPGVDGEPSHFEGWLTVPGAKAAVKVEFSYRPGPKGTLMEYVETSAMEGFAEALVDSVMRADPDYLNKKKW